MGFVRNQAVDPKQFALVQKANMEKLKVRIEEFDYICLSHNGILLSAEAYLDAFINLDPAILNEATRKNPDVTGFGFSGDLDNEEHFFHKFGK